MRAPVTALAATLLFAACVPISSLATASPGDVPDDSWDAPPVGVTIARADGERVLLSTNQPAYVAVFELVPGRGVSMVYPLSPGQRGRTIDGTAWVELAPATVRDERSRLERITGSSSERQLYALASRNPLRLLDPAFDDDYLYRVLSASAYRATDSYETAGALSWQFLPAEQEADWGEDLFTVDASRLDRARLARVYCRDGSVIYVHDELADRGACAWRGRPTAHAGNRWDAPDSVVTSAGRHVAGATGPTLHAPIFHLPHPTGSARPGLPRVASDSAAVHAPRPPRPTPLPSRPEEVGARPRPAEPQPQQPRAVPLPRDEPARPVVPRPRAEPADTVVRRVHPIPVTTPAESPAARPAPRPESPAPAPREERPDTASPSPRPVPAPRGRPVHADTTARVPVG